MRGGEPWPGYRQFCEHYLNPLLLQAVRDVPFQPLLRGNVHGIAPGLAADLLRGSGRRQKGTFTHVRLHARAERRYADTDRERDVRSDLKRAGFGPGLIDAQLRNLQKAIEALRWPRHTKQGTAWSTYTERSHYTDQDLAAKEAFVTSAVGAATPPAWCSTSARTTGGSPASPSRRGGSVVAVDSDHVVVDRLYRDLRQEGEQRILPLVIDLSDPSPALGWRNRERPAFVDRVRPDLVLCLAVVHHLALTNTVPFDEIVAFLADFAAPVVVEFPPRRRDGGPAAGPQAVRGVRRLRPRTWEEALERQFAVRRSRRCPGHPHAVPGRPYLTRRQRGRCGRAVLSRPVLTHPPGAR